MEVDFPRGGAAATSKLKTGTKKRKRKSSATGESETKEKEKQSKKFVKSKYDLVWTNHLRFEAVSTNLLILGCVKSFNVAELRLELVDGFSAVVPITSISSCLLEKIKQLEIENKRDEMPKLNRMFKKGQLLAMKVSSIDDVPNSKKKLIRGTTDPKEVNINVTFNKLQKGQVVMAAIKSVEDKGFQMDIGSRSRYGFLSFKNCHLRAEDGKIGQVLLCTIAESVVGTDRRLIKLKTDEPEILSSFPGKDKLLPGSLMKGRVEKVAPTGLYVIFGDDQQQIGYVPKSKLPNRFDNTRDYEIGSEINCVVTYQTPNSNMVGYSCQEFLFNPSKIDDRSKFNNFRVGDKCQGVVKFISSKNGVYFSVNDGDDENLIAYVSASELQCEKTTNSEKIRKKYPVNSPHELRIKGYSLINRLLYATNQKNHLKQTTINVDDVAPGTSTKAIVEKTTKFGVVVKINEYVNGFIPLIHCGDDVTTTTKDVEKKFQKGQTLKTRVLYADVERDRLILTCKKRLIKSELAILSAYDTASIGQIYDGTVVHLSSTGALISFYGNTKGWLSRTELLTSDVKESPDAYFFLGQVVRVRVLSVDQTNQRMALAPTECSSSITKSSNVSFSNISTKSFQAKVVETTSSGLTVTYGDDKTTEGFLPACHLTDTISDWNLLLSVYRVGDTVGPCVIFSTGARIILSAKPAIVEVPRLMNVFNERLSLKINPPCLGLDNILSSQKIETARFYVQYIEHCMVLNTESVESGAVPESFDGLEEGSFVVGVVSKIHDELGYFIDLPGGHLRALASFSSTDKNVDGDYERLTIGQTVIGRVQQIDALKQRFRVTLKLAACLTEGTKLSMKLLRQYFVNRRRIVEFKLGNGGDDFQRHLASTYETGTIVKCVVSQVTPVGLICSLEKGVKGVVTVEHLAKSIDEYEENEETEAFVLYVDFEEGCLELSLLQTVLKNMKKFKKENSSKKPCDVAKIDQRLRASILLVKKDWILVALELHAKGLLGYLPARLHYNDTSEFGKYKIDERPPVIVRQHFDDETIFVSCVKNEKIYANKNDDPQQTPLQKWVTVEVGKIYDGHVLSVGEEDFFVDVYVKQSQKARVHVSETSETFVDGALPLNDYAPERKIRVKVLGFTKCADGSRTADCTMQKHKLESRKNKKRFIGYKEKFRKGEKIYVFLDFFKNNQFYVDVNPDWKGIINTAHLSLDPDVVGRPEIYFKRGQVFGAYVLSVQKKEKRLNLSLIAPDERRSTRIRTDSTTSDESSTRKIRSRKRTSSSTENSDVKKRLKLSANDDELPRLKVSGGFNWMPSRFSMKNLMEVGLETTTKVNTETTSIKVEANDDDEVEKVKETKNVAKSKFETDKIEEEQLIKKELALLDPERNLNSAEDFDRLLMGSPDSSLLWLRYMAMYLQSGELSKARAVAERALKTISMREENEKFNIWTAMLNMENAYGTKDSLKDVFERAKQVNEPLKVYRHLLKIYEKSNKNQEADELVEEMLKKFKSEFDVWILAGEHFYSSQPRREVKSREIMQRAMKSMPENQQIDVVSRFAQMEFKYADSERGLTLFENLLNEYPKRTDIWSVYIDMTTKHRKVEEARVLFERVTSLKLTTHKLKSFYKKWIDFETRYGTEETKKQIVERSATLFKTDDADKDGGATASAKET